MYIPHLIFTQHSPSLPNLYIINYSIIVYYSVKTYPEASQVPFSHLPIHIFITAAVHLLYSERPRSHYHYLRKLLPYIL